MTDADSFLITHEMKKRPGADIVDKMAFFKTGLARKSTNKCDGLVLPIDTGWLMGDHASGFTGWR